MTLMPLPPEQLGALVSVAVAMLIGGIIGVERELADKPAGLRTHMLVCGAAALLVLLDRMIVSVFSEHFGTSGGVFRADPIGVIGAVVTGVSFLGAGTIIRQGRGEHVEGLTTAASLLFTASLGLCAGLSLWVVAAGGTVLALFTLHGIPYFESWLRRRRDRPKSPDNEDQSSG